MSEDYNTKKSDLQTELSTTVNMKDFAAEFGPSHNEGENVEGNRSMPSFECDDCGQETEDVHIPIERPQLDKRKSRRRTSFIWTKFTVIGKQNQVAVCNFCDQRMSFRGTITNLKKHLERKHGYFMKSGSVSWKKPITPKPRPKLSELAGISEEGITVKVVGEDGEERDYQVIGDHALSEEVVEGDIQEHDYSTAHHRLHAEETVEHEQDDEITYEEPKTSQSRKDPPRLYTPYRSSTGYLDEKKKRQRITDLQIECLENKKYNMQLEALLLEQQLNLPRSIFTEPLRYRDTQTISTQTEVGGSDTRVFYVSDSRNGRPSRQLFAFQDLEF